MRFPHIETESELRAEIIAQFIERDFSNNQALMIFKHISDYARGNSSIVTEKMIALLDILENKYCCPDFDTVYSDITNNMPEVFSEEYFHDWIMEKRADFPRDVEFRYLSLIKNQDWLAYQLRNLWDWNTQQIDGKWYFYHS